MPEIQWSSTLDSKQITRVSKSGVHLRTKHYPSALSAALYWSKIVENLRFAVVVIQLKVDVVFFYRLFAVNINNEPATAFRIWDSISCCAKIEYLGGED